MWFPAAASGQTADDGIMIPSKTLFGGFLFTHDSWDRYWEGPLNRANGNLGSVTTQTSTISVNYGLMDRLNIIATAPYVWTSSSQGVLAGQSGWQDITLAAKLRLFTLPFRRIGSLSVFAVPFGSLPLTDYTPDFLPLSIGTHSKRIGIRSTAHFQANAGLFLTVSGAYTWQGDVTLDRPYYFANNQFFETNSVAMPRAVSYSVSPGYLRKSRMFQFTFNKLITQGGAGAGDIRRQDLPFVSNRVISARVGGVAMVPVPWAPGLAFRFEYSRVVDGRNVGQSNSVTTGLLATQIFGKRRKTP